MLIRKEDSLELIKVIKENEDIIKFYYDNLIAEH